jgi:type III secretory pathway component EscU
MFRKFLFTHSSVEKQLETLRKKGTLIGTRKIDSVTVSVYMLENFFVEVTNSAEEKLCEPVKIFSSLIELQQYMEFDSRQKMNNT